MGLEAFCRIADSCLMETMPPEILELYVKVLIQTLCARIDYEEGKSGLRRLNHLETKLANLEAALRNRLTLP